MVYSSPQGRKLLRNVSMICWFLLIVWHCKPVHVYSEVSTIKSNGIYCKVNRNATWVYYRLPLTQSDDLQHHPIEHAGMEVIGNDVIMCSYHQLLLACEPQLVPAASSPCSKFCNGWAKKVATLSLAESLFHFLESIVHENRKQHSQRKLKWIKGDTPEEGWPFFGPSEST